MVHIFCNCSILDHSFPVAQPTALTKCQSNENIYNSPVAPAKLHYAATTTTIAAAAAATVMTTCKPHCP